MHSNAPNALICLRCWPLPAQQQKLLTSWLAQPNTVLLLTEQALAQWLATPVLFDTVSVPVYALQAEVSNLTNDNPDQAVPAFLLQLSDSAWLDLTLQSQPVLNLG
ncbi:hypothetical protein [Pseudidiomarina salilacus]|uniref:hypothetical protein n=1 Tax=Pseudidiomarina salilacus TaxID=3384452 RepID=UPI0039850A19